MARSIWRTRGGERPLHLARSEVSGADPLELAAISAIGLVPIAAHLVTIRRARRELASPRGGGRFVLGHKRSHLVRGVIYLCASPILVLVVGLRLAADAPSTGAWLLFAVTSAVLAYGWLWWLRALRRVVRWRAAQQAGADS